MASPSPTHSQLRSLVLDYLEHQCFPETAKLFASASTIRNVDADGDELMSADEQASTDQTTHVEIRKDIRRCLFSGKVEDAIQLLERHFPFILSESSPAPSHFERIIDYTPPTSVEPSHLNLNLRILAFTESCRTLPLPYPPSEPVIDFEPVPREALVEKVKKLYELAKLLPNRNDRSIYEKELGNVCGLIAYPTPETCPISRYLSQERREAVADSVNIAILFRLGYSPISSLELYTRYTSTCWSSINALGIEPPSGAILPSTWPKRGTKRPADEVQDFPPFSLGHFIEADTQN